MSDLIDRQAAIDALDEIEAEVAEGLGFEYEKWRKYFCDLPPAEPEQLGTNLAEVGTDTISRAKAIEALMNALNDVGVLDAEDINTVFQMLPPAQPKRPKGKWLSHYDYCKKHGYIPSGVIALWWCDQCEQGVEHPTNFCPNCGAEMEVTE